LQPYQGDRMTDGIHQQSMSLGDPNFGSRRTIDADLAEAWRAIELPRLLQPASQQLAQQLAYELPREAGTVSQSASIQANPNPSVVSADPTASSSEQSETQLEAFAATMTEKFLSVGGSTICLCTWGPADGPLVLCLHGILEQGASWIEVAARLAAQGYRIVAPDLRGHGHSTHVGQGNSYNLMDFLADLDGIVEQIADKPFTLVGHSLGSVIGALFASIRPNRILKLIMVETILPTEVSDDEAAQQLAAHLDYLSKPPKHPVFADVETAAERLRLATPALSKSLAMLLAKRITEPCDGGVRWRWAPLLRTRAGIGFNGINQSRYLGLLRRIRNPITLIYGDRSQFNRQDDLQVQQQALANARRIVVSGGHNLPFDAPSAIADAVLSS
jgi:pimeloyl-ACP methyl ester carboxylesterase